MSLYDWTGYAYDEPSGRWPEAKYGQELALRRLLWSRLMSQVDKKLGTDDSALWRLRTCGHGSGLDRKCENGHEYFTPLGCGSQWCLRCQGMNADLRAMRVHRDFEALEEICLRRRLEPVVVRIQLTLSNEDKASVISCGREGANSLIRNARKAIVRSSGSDGSIPLMVTMHPTSSKRPWVKSPHIHATAIWADMDESGTSMLPWSGSGPVDLDALKSAWGDSYSSSNVVRVKYHKRDPETWVSVSHDGQTLGRAIRYDLRPFQEDVWVALAERRMGVPGHGMRDLQNPWREPQAWANGTTSTKEPLDALQADGGVLLWPRMHRVRRYGAMAPRGFAARLRTMRESVGIDADDNSPMCPCPDCGKSLEVVRNDEGKVYLLRPKDAINHTVKPGWGKSREVVEVSA